MNWQEAAGNIVSALRHADVKKDIIELQEKHLGLLTKEIETLTAENAKLKLKLTDLKKELETLRPKGDRLDDTSEKILLLLANHEQLSFRQIAEYLGISKIKAEHRKDILWKAKMIHFFGEDDNGEACWGLIADGRAYLFKNGLLS